MNQGGFNQTCPAFKWTKNGVVIMHISNFLQVAMYGVFFESTFGVFYKTKGVNNAKNSRSSVFGTPR